MARKTGAVLGLLFLAHAAAAQFGQQGSKLVGTGVIAGHQGWSVGLSADGTTTIVGGPGYLSGGAWVFTRGGGAWMQQGSRLAGTGYGIGMAEQGWSVAISGEGNTAIVGARSDSNPGAAWVFTRSGGVWLQQGGKLVGAGAIGAALQGYSVAISKDGNTVVVGGPGDNFGAGGAWVFTRRGGLWSQQGNKLIGTGAVGAAAQGISVAISADGNTAIVGGPADDSFVGAAWVFTRGPGGWSQQGRKVVGAGAVGPYPARQGSSVAISGDGNTTIVGGPSDNADTYYFGVGAVWVFTRRGDAWTQQGSKLVGAEAVGAANQGHSVAISEGGTTVIVGGPDDNRGAGAAWVFTRSSGVWSQQGSKLIGSGGAPPPADDILGPLHLSVAISGDGNTVIVGKPSDASSAGAAWVFGANGSGPPSVTGHAKH